MWKALFLLVLLALSPGADGLFRSLYRKAHVSRPRKGNPGQPLFLTPYIESGKLIEPQKAPVVLWLQGGPGGSSMFGLFVEHGPYIVRENMTLGARDFPWTTTFSMLYVDNPVGTGFSFTDHVHGYAIDEDDSYAGKYVPAIAHYIHILNPVTTMKINLKGIALGDAYSDPKSIIEGYPSFLFQIGLLDEQEKKYFQKQCNDCVKFILQEKWLQAFELLDRLLDGGLISEPSYFQNVTGCSNYYNLLLCTVLIYNGQLDVIVAASLTERSLMAMDWKGSQKYKKAEKKVWRILKSDPEVAGYVRQVDNFCQTLNRSSYGEFEFLADDIYLQRDFALLLSGN
ncbi:hypothetical protein FD755_012119 [Muntiacus reevesi]|uniref:Serine carboxypeptidase CPVL n=1 Tax=Muntiacus reevesi TaxID=9886 RepID=A0A5N3XNI4_MUNRE|nr:hypothetical protein FD755_012119 [Muntiacus reevesi]